MPVMFESKAKFKTFWARFGLRPQKNMNLTIKPEISVCSFVHYLLRHLRAGRDQTWQGGPGGVLHFIIKGYRTSSVRTFLIGVGESVWEPHWQ